MKNIKTQLLAVLLGTLILFLEQSCSKNNTFIDEPTPTSSNATCENGFAGVFPCNDYDLLAHITLEELRGGSDGNDSWGWTDPISGKEYALMCTSIGVSFVDISNPIDPILVGNLPTATSNSLWRDVKVYNDYAFVVSEASGHGMQVFDLSRLRNVTSPPEVFTDDAHYTQFGNAHNIVINEDSGFAYAVGTNTFGGGPHFVNIQDPLNPTPAGGYSNDSYSHDAQVVTYNGPDADYSGSEILIGSNENEVVIVDVTDKNNPTNISSISYSNIGFTHQGWFTEDQKYFILGDETDEINYNTRTRTLVFDFTDLDNPTFHMQHLGPTTSIDHNVYVKGNLLYQANYTSGIRIIDISNIETNTMTEIGFFDTYPENNSTSFHGGMYILILKVET